MIDLLLFNRLLRLVAGVVELRRLSGRLCRLLGRLALRHLDGHGLGVSLNRSLRDVLRALLLRDIVGDMLDGRICIVVVGTLRAADDIYQVGRKVKLGGVALVGVRIIDLGVALLDLLLGHIPALAALLLGGIERNIDRARIRRRVLRKIRRVPVVYVLLLLALTAFLLVTLTSLLHALTVAAALFLARTLRAVHCAARGSRNVLYAEVGEDKYQNGERDYGENKRDRAAAEERERIAQNAANQTADERNVARVVKRVEVEVAERREVVHILVLRAAEHIDERAREEYRQHAQRDLRLKVRDVPLFLIHHGHVDEKRGNQQHSQTEDAEEERADSRPDVAAGNEYHHAEDYRQSDV